MKHDVSIVTCVYDNLHSTELAGRHNRGTHYAFSLAQVCDMGVPVYCYTDTVNANVMLPALLWHGIDNVNLRGYDLKTSTYYERIQAVKDSNPTMYRESPAWKSRCVEIMWGKFDIILDAIEKVGASDDKYMFWFDAGISHPGVLPLEYNTNHSQNNDDYKTSAHEYMHRFFYDKAFNDKLPDYLVDYMGDCDLFHMFCTSPQHSDPSHLDTSEKIHVGTAVGGIFGGRTSALKDWVIKAKAVCDDLLTHGHLLKEEDVLSFMINDTLRKDPEFANKLKMYKFNTWYHSDWIAWNPAVYDPKIDISFSDFFKEFIGEQE